MSYKEFDFLFPLLFFLALFRSLSLSFSLALLLSSSLSLATDTWDPDDVEGKRTQEELIADYRRELAEEFGDEET